LKFIEKNNKRNRERTDIIFPEALASKRSLSVSLCASNKLIEPFCFIFPGRLRQRERSLPKPKEVLL